MLKDKDATDDWRAWCNAAWPTPLLVTASSYYQQCMFATCSVY